MGDAYWSRQQQPLVPSSGMLKRPRPDYELAPPGGPSGSDAQNYQVQDDERGVWVVKDTKTIGSAYDRYLQSTQLSSLNTGEASTFIGAGIGRTAAATGGMCNFPGAESPAMAHPGPLGHDLTPNGRSSGFGVQLPVDNILPMPGREPIHLPPDASATLFVEGLPTDTTKREVAHIFRPFVGYKEVRLVTKESKHRGGDPLTFCFVDFINPPCAATALSALQGYKMDEHDPDSTYLRLQFARNPPRSGPRSHPRR